MIVIEQYTVKQRYCDRCGCKEDADSQSALDSNGMLWHWHHKSDFRLPDFSDGPMLTAPNYLDRIDLCPHCYYHYQHEQGLA